MKSLSLVLLTALLTGCANDRPKANLTFEGIRPEGHSLAIEFLSDKNFDALYADNKQLNIVRKALMCSLTSDENFDVEHQLKYEFRGDVELAPNAAKTNGGFRYRSVGGFYENVSSSNSAPLSDDAVRRLLVGKDAIKCKVLMTIYLSSPYYSNIMLVPTDKIRSVTSK